MTGTTTCIEEEANRETRAPATDAAFWARKINAAIADSVAAIIATGQALIDAKGELPHGQFERLFANHPNPLPEPVNCTPDWARRFMSIASNALIANGKYASHFPQSIETLSALAKLPEDKLEVALSEGWVRPEMQKADVKEIKGRLGITPVGTAGCVSLSSAINGRSTARLTIEIDEGRALELLEFFERKRDHVRDILSKRSKRSKCILLDFTCQLEFYDRACKQLRVLHNAKGWWLDEESGQ
jgi:hypothetical protein